MQMIYMICMVMFGSIVLMLSQTYAPREALILLEMVVNWDGECIVAVLILIHPLAYVLRIDGRQRMLDRTEDDAQMTGMIRMVSASAFRVGKSPNLPRVWNL